LTASMGCSLFGKKKDESPVEAAKAPDTNLTSQNVYDAGSYSEKEDISDLRIRGGKLFDTVPSEKFYSVDREKVAPVGKLFYVVTNEDPNRCIPAKYSVLDNKKKLVVYSKTTVPTTYCIYQKTPSADPAGFVIDMKDGGMCKPGIITSQVDDNKKTISVVETFNKIVSMKYCFENTISFGLGKSHMTTADGSDQQPTKKRKKSAEAPAADAPVAQ
jgi:hypothetical protein